MVATTDMDMFAPVCAFATISLIGSLIIILSYVYIPSMRRSPIKYVANVACAEVVWVCSIYFPAAGTDEGYNLGGLLGHVGGLSVELWVAVLIFVMRTMVQDFISKAPGRPLSMWLAYFIAFGLPLLLSIPGLAKDTYVPLLQGWCWVDSDYPYIRFFTFYLPSIFVMLFVFFQLAKTKTLIDTLTPPNTEPSAETKTFKQVISRLSLYIYVYLIVRVWGLITRIAEWSGGLAQDDDDNVSFITAVFAILSSLRGTMNALVYMQSKHWQREARAIFRDTIGTTTGRTKVYEGTH